MSDGFPSMTALLGLLAIAGYQNRDKIAEMLSGAAQSAGQAPAPAPAGAPAGGAGGLGGLLAGHRGADAGGFLNSGLGQMLERFTQAGQGEAAQSWIARGPNRELPPQDMGRAIGADVLDALSRQTGLSRDELLARLSRELPAAVDRYTPDGRIPA